MRQQSTHSNTVEGAMVFAIVIFGTAGILMGWIWYGSYLADQKRAQYVNVWGYVYGGSANSYPLAVKFTSDNGTTYTVSILHTIDYDLSLAKGHAYEAEAIYPSHTCTGGMLNLTRLTPNTVSFNVTCQLVRRDVSRSCCIVGT